ncbi:hypothetical protein AVEN_88212-1 [Araneus ventricosus]|uniref:Uncharacterized protein n=1 Tax=Araneus ventricosus TaxID=182803 RepID=A0A4Y2HW19_ARAVE|nr:hypothetical protein AVEN_88212-1 [Araneus ventricosus]
MNLVLLERFISVLKLQFGYCIIYVFSVFNLGVSRDSNGDNFLVSGPVGGSEGSQVNCQHSVEMEFKPYRIMITSKSFEGDGFCTGNIFNDGKVQGRAKGVDEMGRMIGGNDGDIFEVCPVGNYFVIFVRSADIP